MTGSKAPMDINHVIAGTSSPTLIFVHGFACALEDWQAQIDALSPRYRCVALDLPGHGRTPLRGRGSMAQLAAVVNELRDAVAPGPVVFVGHSLGVRVIVDAYLARPMGVEGLIFVDGRFYDGNPDEVRTRMTSLIDSAGFDAFIANAFSGMFTAQSARAVKDRVVERARRMDPDFGRALLLESILWDSTRGRDTLRRIEIPLLHLQSSDIDAQRRLISLKPGMRTAFMKLVEELVPGARIAIAPDIGHFATIEAPALVTREIERFLSR